MGRNTNLTGRIAARLAADTTEIFQFTDFEDISLPAVNLGEKLYIIKDSISSVAPYQFIFAQGATTLFIAVDKFKALVLALMPIDAFFETASGSGNLTINIDEIVVINAGNPVGSVTFDLTFLAPAAARALGGFSTFVTEAAVYRGFETLGTISNTEIIGLENWFFAEFEKGIIFDGTGATGVTNTVFITNGTGSGASIELKGAVGAFALRDTSFTMVAGESALRIDPGVSNNARISINNAAVKGPGSPQLFDTSGTDGTFTSTSDASSSNLSVTSVTSGTVVNGTALARFNFTGTPPDVFDVATMSGFSPSNNYNGEFATLNSFAGAVELNNVIFVADDTGTLAQIHTQIAATAHGLSNGDTLTLRGDTSIDYDGGHTIFDVLTNSFSVGATFVATDTGTWSTRGLDHTDPRVLASNNGGFLSSKYIACSFVNDNATATTISMADTYQDLDFGTIFESTVAERFKMIDSVSGATQYFGNEPFEGSLFFDLSAVSTGSGSIFKFKFVRQIGGSGAFVDFADIIEGKIDVKTTITTGSLILPVVLNQFDVYKIVVNNTLGTENITVSDISIYGQ